MIMKCARCDPTHPYRTHTNTQSHSTPLQPEGGSSGTLTPGVELTRLLVTAVGDTLIKHRIRCFFLHADLPFSPTKKDTPMKGSRTR